MSFTKKYFITTIILLCQILLNNQSQSQTFQWVQQEGASSTREIARKTKFDQSGNMYVIGTFGGLNGGTTVFGNISLTSIGAVDIFIAKYDINRDLVWVKQGGSIYYDYIYGLEFDQSGNIYVSGIFSKSTGNFSAPMFFGNSTLQGFGKADIFLVKLSTDGDLIWAKSFGSTEDDQLNGLTRDEEEKFYITGGYRNNITFGKFTLVNTAGYYQTYITKFDSNGNFLWAKNTTGTNNCIGVDIASDGTGNIITTGFFSSSSSFENITINSNGENDIFLTKYNSSGDLLWAKGFGGIFFDYGLKVESDNSGNIFLTGSFESVLNFGNNVIIQSNGGIDVYLCKFDRQGTAIWAKNSGGPTINGFTSNESPSDILTDSQGNTYLTGYFNGRMVFEKDTLLSESGSSDVYIVKYDREGSVKFKKQIRSLTAASYVFSWTLSGNNSGELIVSGSFLGSAAFDNIVLFSAGNSEDLFFGKISSFTGIQNNFSSAPKEFLPLQNYPNPFNPNTIIKYLISSNVIDRESNVILKIYDALGNEVETLVNEKQLPGSYKVKFDGSNLPSGIYFCKLQAADYIGTKIMILLK